MAFQNFGPQNWMLLPLNEKDEATRRDREDQELKDALMKKWASHGRPQSDILWKSKDGRETPIESMNTTHLRNTIKMIEEDRHGTIKVGNSVYNALKREWVWRQKTVNRHRREEREGELSKGGIFFNY